MLYIGIKCIPMRNKHTKESLEKAVKNSKTWADVCRNIGVKPMTGAQCYIKKRVGYFEIDTSHFLGKSVTKGRIAHNKKPVLSYCYNGSTINSHTLKKKLIKEGLKKEQCEICGITEWMGDPVVLELDHKDSNHYNNGLWNLQILCPNCHAQQTRNRRGVAGTVDNSVLETEAK